jgi:uncharacterized ferritin-like protein (DUF455 family)
MAENVREVAERILFSSSLEDKLLLGPREAEDDFCGKAIKTPRFPERPESLTIGDRGIRADFPGFNRIADEKDRGIMMHFLANHELLAAELMALVLLKFPDAPKDYRAGVYEAMREEQMHTQMYFRRMRDCGISFGELPLNDYFWRIVSSMDTIMDFVVRMNLTFEQANLDYSKYYAEQFRVIGDTGTAAVLDKIYQDEINHVGHGLKWLRHWKKKDHSDWEAFSDSLQFPLSPSRAKGMVSFNLEGRLEAGFDEEFISQMKVSGQSRGRTPVVHWFNPNAELYSLASVNETEFRANRFERAIEEDLEILMFAWSRKDDVALFRNVPSVEHLEKLQSIGFQLPEVLPRHGLDGRKLGGLRPWAWSIDASDHLKPYGQAVSDRVPWQWRKPIPESWLSKEIGVSLEQKLGVRDEVGGFCRNLSEVMDVLRGGTILFKSAYGCSGKGHMIAESFSKEVQVWAEKKIQLHGFIVAEPLLQRVEDFSVLYEIQNGEIECLGMTQLINDSRGQFRGIRLAPRFSKMLSPEVLEFLFKEADFISWYHERIPSAILELLPEYCGPVGVDALVWRDDDGRLMLRHVVELNVRMTMGRVALELQKKLNPNGWADFSIQRKEKYKGGGVILNDPDEAKEFLAIWESHQGDSKALIRK